MVEKFLSDIKFLTDEGFEATTWHHKIKGTTESLVSMLRAGFLLNFRDGVVELAKKDKSIMIIWGRKDNAVTAENAVDMENMLKDSTVEIFENAGHLPNVEEAETFNSKVIPFLLG